MGDAGDIYLADLGGGRRHRVLIVSSARFNRSSGRALVAPSVAVPVDDLQPPWRIAVESDLFAIDALRTLDEGRLLERVGRADQESCRLIRRAVHAIT